MALLSEESSKDRESCNKPYFHDNYMWHHFPKVDMSKFDGSKPNICVTQMEHCFTLNAFIDDMMKLRVGILYLDQE
jgi:hypothetical protein